MKKKKNTTNIFVEMGCCCCCNFCFAAHMRLSFHWNCISVSRRHHSVSVWWNMECYYILFVQWHILVVSKSYQTHQFHANHVEMEVIAFCFCKGELERERERKRNIKWKPKITAINRKNVHEFGVLCECGMRCVESDNYINHTMLTVRFAQSHQEKSELFTTLCLVFFLHHFIDFGSLLLLITAFVHMFFSTSWTSFFFQQCATAVQHRTKDVEKKNQRKEAID